MRTPNYSIQLYWLNDGADEWVALSPEFPGCSCFGKSRASALEKMESLLSDISFIIQYEGEEPLPKPITLDGYNSEFPLQPKSRMA